MNTSWWPNHASFYRGLMEEFRPVSPECRGVDLIDEFFNCVACNCLVSASHGWGSVSGRFRCEFSWFAENEDQIRKVLEFRGFGGIVLDPVTLGDGFFVAWRLEW
jgi:hypothetical protein